jgi:hypothetical protein
MKTLAAVLLMLAPAVAEAQWTRDLGEGYVNLTVNGLTSTRQYGADFEVAELPSRYSQIVLSLYGEVGLVDRWLTLMVTSELLRNSRLSEQGATLGLGDTEIGLFSGLIADPVRLTIGVEVGLPTGDHEPTGGDGADDQADEIARSLPTGDGEFDVEPRVLFGWSFGGDSWPLSHYLGASFGYAIRTSAKFQGERQAFADAITYHLEFGTKFPLPVLDRFWWMVRLHGIESFASDEEAARGASGIGNGVTYTAFDLGFSAEIYGGFGVLFKVGGAARARSIIAAAAIRGGLYYEF